MKASVNKITEGAKLRDTLGRNRVTNLTNEVSLGMQLDYIQVRQSSDNVEKLTNIIIIDKDTGAQWLLKYRVLLIDDSVVSGDDMITCFIKSMTVEKRKLFLDALNNNVAVKEDENNDSE